MLSLPDNLRQKLCDLAQQSDCLIFGELHGTQEVPQLLATLLDDLTALGYGALGLEIDRAEQEPIMRWASGASDAMPRVFAQPSGDGTGNEQALALIRQVVAASWQVLCFDVDPEQGCTTWQMRDSAMADHLAAGWQRCCPDRKVVAVCGNLHSRLTPGPEQFAELWPSFAACFQQRHPRSTVRSVNLVFHGGSFFNNYQVHTLPDDPLDEAELQDDPVMGHSFALHLPRATPPTFLAPPSK